MRHPTQIVGAVSTCKVSLFVTDIVIPTYSYCPSAYDDLAVRDSYFPDERQRRLSQGAHNSIVPRSAMISSSMMSNHRPRRRSSSVSFDMRATAPPMDTFRRLSGAVVKLKRKGASRSGLSLGDAQNNVRLSGNNSYTFADFNCNVHGRITLKIRVSTCYTNIHQSSPDV